MRGRSKYVIASTLAAIHHYLPRNTWKPHLIGEQIDPWVRRPFLKQFTEPKTILIFYIHSTVFL